MNHFKPLRFFQKNFPLQWRILLLLISDCVAMTTIFGGVVYGYLAYFVAAGEPRDYWWFIIYLPFWGLINSFFRCYQGSFLYPGIGLNRIEEIRRLSYSVIIIYLLMMSYIIFLHHTAEYSLGVFVISLVLSVLILPLARFATRLVMKHLDIGQINVLIAGAGQTGQLVGEELTHSCYYGFRVVGYLDDDLKKRKTTLNGIPVLGTLHAAKRLAFKYNVNYLICCLPNRIMDQAYRKFSLNYKYILYIPDSKILPISWLYPAAVGFLSGFEIRNQLLLVSQRYLKTLLEIISAGVAIIVLFPVFVILALIVKLSSPGPVFYAAERLGKHGRKIQVYKFRTMYADAEKRLQVLLRESPELKAEWRENFKLQDDPRITRIGRFLRKTSLDELPQFWNVLTGEMALIGPRPIVEAEIPHYGETYELRQRVKPGITGLWQISGRSDTDYEQRTILDMYYIMNWSIWLDYYIFFKTVFIVLTCRGAR